MQYMLAATTKANLSPSDAVAILTKFQSSWQPPKGLTVEGIWTSGPHGFVLVTTDDYSLAAELMAQFSVFNSWVAYPVLPAEDLVPAMLRGYEWAR